MSSQEQTQEDVDKKLVQLENTLRFKKWLMRNRDPLREEDKIVKAKERGKVYVDHLQEEINILEWAIQFIQSHS